MRSKQAQGREQGRRAAMLSRGPATALQQEIRQQRQHPWVLRPWRDHHRLAGMHLRGRDAAAMGSAPLIFTPFPATATTGLSPRSSGGAMRALLAARPPVPGHPGAPSLLPTAMGGVKARGARRDSRQHLPPPTAKGKGVWLIARVKYFSKNISFPPK